MINHDAFYDKWLCLPLDKEQEEAMKNYMLGLSAEELPRFLLWRTEEKSFRAAQEKGDFSDETRRKTLKQSDKRIALKRVRPDTMRQLSLFWENLSWNNSLPFLQGRLFNFKKVYFKSILVNKKTRHLLLDKRRNFP